MQNLHDNSRPLILGIDSSTATGCAAIFRDGELISEEISNNGLTHSQTLLPMVSRVIENAGVTANDISLIAVTVGPGSFTGLRIGLSTAKGIAAFNGAKCIGLSTLETLANSIEDDGLICAVCDARCKRVFNALFERKDGKLTRIYDDKTTECVTLAEELLAYERPITLIGDGAKVCDSIFSDYDNLHYNIKDDFIRGRALCSLGEIKSDTAVDYKSLNPTYIQLPQAQRELLLKQKGVVKE